MSQTVTGTRTIDNPDGSVTTITTYSDGSWSSSTTAPDGSTTANLQALQTKAQQALANNATFQAIASPSNAQNAAQVQALTKQCNGIIRLLLGLLDTTAGT